MMLGDGSEEIASEWGVDHYQTSWRATAGYVSVGSFDLELPPELTQSSEGICAVVRAAAQVIGFADFLSQGTARISQPAIDRLKSLNECDQATYEKAYKSIKVTLTTYAQSIIPDPSTALTDEEKVELTARRSLAKSQIAKFLHGISSRRSGEDL
jgi:hypothetical protein